MTGYSPALAVLAQLGRLDLVGRYAAAHPNADPELVAGMSRDTLIAALLPPAAERERVKRRRIARHFPEEASWR